MKVLITSPQRCGSTWLTRITASLFKEPFTGNYIQHNKEPKLSFNTKNPTAISNFIELINDHGRIATKTHDVSPLNWEEILKQIPELKITTITRDFKDIVISRYFYDRYHKLPIDPSQKRRKIVESAINNEQDDIKAINKLCYTDLFEKWLRNWKVFNLPDTNERVFKTRYEKLFETEEIKRYIKFLGAPENIAEHIQKMNNYKLYHFCESRLARNISSNKERFCRNGKIGDHKNYMTEETIKYINERCSAPPDLSFLADQKIKPSN